MFELRGDWYGGAAELMDLIPELARERNATSEVLSGATGSTAQEEFAKLFDGDYAVDKLGAAMVALGDAAHQGGGDIEYTKLQVVTTLAIAAAEIVYALAMMPWTFGESEAWIPAIETISIAAIRAAVAQGLKRLATVLAESATKTGVRRLVTHMGEEALEETVIGTVQEAAIQQGQVHAGHAEKFKPGQLGKNMLGSGTGAATGAVGYLKVKELVEGAKTFVGKLGAGAAAQAAAGATGGLGSAAAGGPLDGASVLGGVAAGAMTPGGVGPDHPTSPAPPDSVTTNPLPTTNPPTQNHPNHHP